MESWKDLTVVLSYGTTFKFTTVKNLMGVGVYHGSDYEYCLMDVTPCTDIPEEAAASISRVPCIKAAGSCVISVHIYQITQCHIPRQSNLHAKSKLQFLGLC